MMFGDYEKMMKAVAIAKTVTDNEPIVSTRPVNKIYNRALAETAGKPLNVQDDFDDLDNLFDDVTKALTECNNIQKPLPAVNQKDFVKAAVNKQKSATPTKKPELPKQPKVQLVKMESNEELNAKGAAFKQYILENFGTSDKALVEAINSVFDIMVLGKIK